MQDVGRDIPGFYFDRQKGRYFRKIPGHLAPRPEYKHIEANVKAELKNEKFRARQEFKKRTYTHGAISGPSLVPWSTFRPLLNRELGYYGTRAPSRPNVAAQWGTTSAGGFRHSNLVPHNNPLTGHFHFFARDPRTNTIYLNHTSRHIVRIQPTEIEEGGVADEKDLPYLFDIRRHEQYYTLGSQVSSMNFSAASGTLVMTSFGGPNTSPTVHFSNPEEDGPGVAEVFSLRDTPAVWTSSILPLFSTDDVNSVASAQTEIVAVGKQNGFVLFHRKPSGKWVAGMAKPTQTDVLSLCWLSPHLLAVGCRNSQVLLYDTRADGASHIIRHNTCVTNIKATDHFDRIVCAGVQDSLALYDMRMSKVMPIRPADFEQAGSSRAEKRRKIHAILPPATLPVLKFAWSNEGCPDLGLDTYPRLGLLAGSDEYGRIQIWSLLTGHVLRHYGSLTARGNFEGGRGKTVRFVENDGGDSPVSIWATYNDEGICRFGW